MKTKEKKKIQYIISLISYAGKYTGLYVITYSASNTYINSWLLIIFSSLFLAHIYHIIGGARGVMVIVVGNGHGDTSSNPEWDWLNFI